MSVIDNGHGTMAIEEVWMTSIDIAGFHGDKVADQFVGGVHDLLEEADDHGMKFFFQLWIPSEKRLLQELAQNSHKFVVH